MRASNLSAESPLQILDSPPVSARIHQRHPLSIHIKQLAAFIVAFIIVLGFVLGLWFDISTRTLPRLTFPYYNALKPVPPWSDPRQSKAITTEEEITNDWCLGYDTFVGFSKTG